MYTGKRCGCFHHSIIPVLIVLLALVILLGNLGVISVALAGTLWPIILGLIGLQKLLVRRCRCCYGCDCPCGSPDHNHSKLSG